jgi:peptide/nickel transport system ATP-binding protein
MSMDEVLLSIQDLQVQFRTYAGTVYAVNGMSFDVLRGEIFGLVGESGCGKSVTSLAVMRILPGQGRLTGGRILFDGQDLALKSDAEMREVRGRRIAMIFQDPSASLNPVFSVGNQVRRIIRYHTRESKRDANQRAVKLFEEVALPDPERILELYPHELSGGMQQRVMIAMALASGAELLIADEPTTALDVTIQSQILELLVDLRQRQGLSILLITHNLGVVAETCDRVGVAYAGRIVETGPTESVLNDMKHPYTQGLLAALPTPEQKGHDLHSIPGNVPDGLSRLSGCPFQARCPHVMEVCRDVKPPWVAFPGGQRAACHLYVGEAIHA